MRHKITCETYIDDGFFVAQPECVCGWKGSMLDVATPEERKRYEREVTTHRITTGVARGLSCFMIATALLWLSAITVGAVWLVRALAGL